MKRTALFLIVPLLAGLTACGADGNGVITTRPDAVGRQISVRFEAGAHYKHPLKINRIITIKTTPQIAVWIEDTDGLYIDTLYVTKRAGTQAWRTSPDLPAESIRRPESLPLWSHKRGVVYPDGLFMPTRDNPLTDAVTAASPKGDFHLTTKTPQDLLKFVVLAEINNSADFNDAYPADAQPGTPSYSGGSWGSGQPSVVYAATVDLASGPGTWSSCPSATAARTGATGASTPTSPASRRQRTS